MESREDFCPHSGSDLLHDVEQKHREDSKVRHIQKQKDVPEVTVHRVGGKRKAFVPSFPYHGTGIESRQRR